MKSQPHIRKAADGCLPFRDDAGPSLFIVTSIIVQKKPPKKLQRGGAGLEAKKKELPCSGRRRREYVALELYTL